MAAVWCLPSLHVTINELDDDGVHYPVQSNQIGAATPTWTKHAIVVRRSTRFAVGLNFRMDSQPKSHILIGDYVEVGVQFDGISVAHRRIPVDEIIAKGGRYVFDAFADGDKGVKVAEMRPIKRARSSVGEDEDTLLRAQALGKIEIAIAHGKGVMLGIDHDPSPALLDNTAFSDKIVTCINASHYIHYSPPKHPLQPTVTPHFVDNSLAGEVGYFDFLYGSMEALCRADPRVSGMNAAALEIAEANPFYGPLLQNSVPTLARPISGLIPGDYPPARFSAPRHAHRASLDADADGNINCSATLSSPLNKFQYEETPTPFTMSSPPKHRARPILNRSVHGLPPPPTLQTRYPGVPLHLIHNTLFSTASDVTHASPRFTPINATSTTAERRDTTLQDEVQIIDAKSLPATHPFVRATTPAFGYGDEHVGHLRMPM